MGVPGTSHARFRLMRVGPLLCNNTMQAKFWFSSGRLVPFDADQEVRMQPFYELPTSLELSSDLEWMLQSGQVDDTTLAKTLLKEYYGQLFCLFKAIFENEEELNVSIYQTFAMAVARRHTYRAELGVS